MAEYVPGRLYLADSITRGLVIARCLQVDDMKGKAVWEILGTQLNRVMHINLERIIELPRQLVVIDADDYSWITDDVLDAFREGWEAADEAGAKGKRVRTGLKAMVRTMAYPKPYREVTGRHIPWPDVPECHSGHDEGHECPQCAWEHEHEWVAWTYRKDGTGAVPIRCAKCGGRKCDLDRCPKQRHTHNHQDGAV